jgi:hypothetical protein
MSSILEPQDDEPIVESEDNLIIFQTDETVSSSVIDTQDTSVLTVETGPETCTFETAQEDIVTLATITEVTSVIETAAPRGLQGEKGDGSITLEYPVAYAMSGHRIVVLNESQQAIYASNAVPAHATKILGMTTEAVISGDIRIQNGGVLTEPSWTWTLDIPIWLGVDGLMTQTAPVSGFSLIVGFPISSTSMFIDIREPIFLI